jgi:hypothetical protein
LLQSKILFLQFMVSAVQLRQSLSGNLHFRFCPRELTFDVAMYAIAAGGFAGAFDFMVTTSRAAVR